MTIHQPGMIHALQVTEIGDVPPKRRRAVEDELRVTTEEDQPTAALLSLREMGWLEAGGNRIFLCETVGGFFTLREQIAREIGREAQADVFYRAGFSSAERLTRSALTQGRITPSEEGLRSTLAMLSMGGYGGFHVSEARIEENWAIVDVRNSMESHLYNAEAGPAGLICDYTRGLMRGILYAFQGQHAASREIEAAEISCVANGDDLCRFVIGTTDELSSRGYRAGGQEFTSVRETLLRLNRQLENVLESAQRDSLTGLYNRAFFEDALRRRIEFANRRTDSLSVALIDVDRFKEVNDTRGHGTGDIALQQIAKLIGAQGRDTDVVARYGGDEFAMLMPGTPIEAAVKVADRIRLMVQQEMRGEIPLTLSIGVAACPQDATTMTDLLAYADEAMYQVKEQGGNGVRQYLASTNATGGPRGSALRGPRPRQDLKKSAKSRLPRSR